MFRGFRVLGLRVQGFGWECRVLGPCNNPTALTHKPWQPQSATAES